MPISMASTWSSGIPSDDKLLLSLLRLCGDISAAKSPRTTGALQKRNIASVRRVTQLLSVLFVDILRLDASATSLPLLAVLCLREILTVLRRFQALLLACSTRMSRMHLALQSQMVSHKFHRLMRDLAILLDIFPVDEIDVSAEVRELVDLLKDQCRRWTDASDAEGKRLRTNIVETVGQIEKEIVPPRSTLEEMFGKLGLDDAQACKDEMSKLEVEIRDGVAGIQTETLVALLGVVRYAKCVVFGASTPRQYSSSMEDVEVARSISFSETVVIPEDFRCPITMDLMKNPVVATSGQSYDRESIEHWFKAGHKTCPKTGQIIQDLHLIPNLALENLISQWCRDEKLSFEDKETLMSSSNSQANHGCMGSNKAALEVARMTASFLVHKLSNNSTTTDAANRIVHELRQLAKTGADNRAFIAEAGAIPLLLPLLKSNDPSLQVNAVTAVLDLSFLNKNKKRIMKCPGGLESVIALLKFGATWKAKNKAARTLLSLSSFHSVYRKRIGREPSVAVALAELVLAGPTSSKHDGLNTFLDLARVRENIGNLVESGVVPAALETTDTSEVTDMALAVLAAVAKRGGAVAMGATRGFVAKMVRALRQGTGTAREGAATALVYVCRFGGDGPVRELLNIPGIEWMIWGMLASGSANVRRKAAALAKIYRQWEGTQDTNRPAGLSLLGFLTAA